MINAFFNLTKHIDKRFFKDTATENSLEESIVNWEIFDHGVAYIETLNNMFDSTVLVWDELLLYEKICDD